MSNPVEMRPMTALERARALALGGCSFPCASFSKRFARALGSGRISEREAARLAVQCYIYRRQVPSAAVGCEVRGEIAAIPRDLVPLTPPEGYMTPREREALARLEVERRRLAAEQGETLTDAEVAGLLRAATAAHDTPTGVPMPSEPMLFP